MRANSQTEAKKILVKALLTLRTEPADVMYTVGGLAQKLSSNGFGHVRAGDIREILDPLREQDLLTRAINRSCYNNSETYSYGINHKKIKELEKLLSPS